MESFSNQDMAAGNERQNNLIFNSGDPQTADTYNVNVFSQKILVPIPVLLDTLLKGI